MIDIKFRGKKKAGEWVYGYYLVNELNNEHKIHCKGSVGMSTYIVAPETVGQYTGLKDKNGKEIYEGDIVNSWAHLEDSYIRTVVKDLKTPSLVFSPITGFDLCKNNEYCFEIIGNIHEEPSCLEISK